MSRSKAEIARKREARRAAKLNEREKLALEARLVREGKIYPRAHYMPRGRFRGILAVALAFFFGIILAFGGLIGAGVFLGTKTSLKSSSAKMRRSGSNPNMRICPSSTSSRRS